RHRIARRPARAGAKGVSAPGQHKASMLQDVDARPQTEVDSMNGACEWGAKAGVPAVVSAHCGS
ncbi:MAG: hypothetical protein L0Z50_29050, partial [Verrucomicrobiales bacterium]|nr:hypothetical protein [Verrucomicrobiales bacterium]